MKPKQNLPNTQEISEESETDNTLSIDEFFKQLEAKEKDLDISSDLVIEIEEVFVERIVSGAVKSSKF